MKANKLVLMLCSTMAMGLVFAGCTSNLDSAGDISGAEVELGTDELGRLRMRGYLHQLPRAVLLVCG